MRMLLPFLGLCASMASAIKIATPVANSTQVAGGSTVVQWSTVDTDPDQFSIYLVNFVNWPPSYVPLALDVPTSAQTATVQIPCDTNPSWGYQINAINGTNTYVIYAQSSKFSVSPALSPCVASPSTSPTCAAPSTVTVTVSNTGLPSNPSSPPALAVSTPSSSHHSTSPGTVPKTIGWSSGYSNPVTIDIIPTPKPARGNGQGVAPGPVTSVEVSPPQPTEADVTVTTWVTVTC